MRKPSLLEALNEASKKDFEAVLAVIDERCVFKDCRMVVNGVKSAKGENLGSKKVLGVAVLLGKKASNFLNWFAEHYNDVLNEPGGTNHANIRAVKSALDEGKRLTDFITFRGCENPITLK